MKKKHLKAVKKLGLERDRDVRAKKVVGIWKGRTWKTKSRVGSGNVTPVTVTEPVTRAGSEDEDEDEDDEDEDGDEDEDDDGDGGNMVGPIRRRSEGVTVDVNTHIPHPHPLKFPTISLTIDARLITHITQYSSLLPLHLPHPSAVRRLVLR